MQIKFFNSYLDLPKIFYSYERPDFLQNPQIITFNKNLSSELELEGFCKEEILKNFSKDEREEKSPSISLIYAGHQFGHFSPQLGDGRAVLLGQVKDKNNSCFDLQLKGSGRTKFSRNGDGKYPLHPAIKEYIISEAVFHLGIPTTRSLCLISTNEPVFRENSENGAILCRVAKSHIRFGTFEYFYHQNDLENIRILSDFSIKNYYPKCQEKENPYLSFFKEVYKNQIELISNWMSFGFIHGVMNTDNCLISGEAIDFGPCAFMDEYKKDQTFSYIDRHGRYSYENQKPITLWNLIRFAESILPLINPDLKIAISEIEKIIADFESDFDKKYYSKMLKKIGLQNDCPQNRNLVDEFLEMLEENNLDFTNSFRNLSNKVADKSLEQFITKLKSAVKEEGGDFENSTKLMNKHNPVYIPRSHIIQKISDAAIKENDYTKLEEFLKIIQNPFKEQNVDSFYQGLPKEEERVENTFCGT